MHKGLEVQEHSMLRSNSCSPGLSAKAKPLASTQVIKIECICGLRPTRCETVWQEQQCVSVLIPPPRRK